MDDYRVYLVKLPGTVHGAIRIDNDGFASIYTRNLQVLIVRLFFLPVMLPSVLPRLGTDSAVRFPGV